MTNFIKVETEMAFVLHQRPFKNTSLIIELFTKNFGRISVIAKGVKRKQSLTLGILTPFLPLLISFQGKSELKTLTSTETSATKFNLAGMNLYCGFYLNELIMLCLSKEDPHAKTFIAYQKTLSLLNKQQDVNMALRQFEYSLLNDLGLGFDVRFDKFNLKIMSDKNYIFNNGLELSNSSLAISGKCLQNLISDSNATDIKCRNQLKKLLQNQLNLILNGRKINSRDLLQDYLQL